MFFNLFFKQFSTLVFFSLNKFAIVPAKRIIIKIIRVSLLGAEQLFKVGVNHGTIGEKLL